MAIIKSLKGFTPQMGNDCFLADNAVVVGDVQMGDGCSIWFGAVVRGDVNHIRMGNKVNIQDNATVHGTYQKHGTVLGDNVSIAHNAVIHGCTIHDNVLIGMGTIVMDGAVIHSNVIVAAGSVVTQGTQIPSGELWAGIPAKKIKDLPDSLKTGEIERIANNYSLYSSWYK